ncbi:hypothetical protein ACET3Z_000429 [Daucus carota]
MCVGGASKRAVGRGIMFSSSQWSHPLQRPQRDQSWGCSQVVCKHQKSPAKCATPSHWLLSVSAITLGSRPELRDAGPILADGGSSRGNSTCTTSTQFYLQKADQLIGVPLEKYSANILRFHDQGG